MNLFLIPLLPLIAFSILILVGRRLGKFSAVVSLLALLGSAILCVRLFLLQGISHLVPSASLRWLSLGQTPLRLGLMADPLSITMGLVVTVVGWLIMLYSVGYMGSDPRFSRFFAYLSLFCSAMLLLVLADNLIFLYIGWELVGLCSYLLIGFWFERPAAAHAGKKAFLTTRVGDLGLLGAILLIVWLTRDVSFNQLEAKAVALGAWGPIVAFLIFWGAAGKSAQIPLHVWLPDAMEGPTPVSALIHAATMVAAGVYLVARMLPLFLVDPNSLLLVAAIGGLTSFMAATIACTQTDLKRILAYSTISQLGFMMLALGCGSAFAGMFHLVTHAWFKALLFLGAGSVIHAVHHQEVTRMGGLWKQMPVTAFTFTVAALAMAGIRPLSGFWSKEEIFMTVAGFSHPRFPYAGQAFLGLALSVAFLTAFYISRAVILTFFGARRHSEKGAWSLESPPVMTGPLLILSLGAMGIGLLGTPWAGNGFQHFLGIETHGAHHGPDWIAPASILIAVAGIALSLLRYGLGVRLLWGAFTPLFLKIYKCVVNKYYIDELYDRLIVRPYFRLAERAFSFDSKVIDGAVNGSGTLGLRWSALKGWVDQHIVDGFVNGVAIAVGRTGATLRLLQTGLVQNYLLIAFTGALSILLILRWIF